MTKRVLGFDKYFKKWKNDTLKYQSNSKFLKEDEEYKH